MKKEKSEKNLYIGIDFSMSSPGICFLEEDILTNKKSYEFFSVIRKTLTKSEKLLVNKMPTKSVKLEYFSPLSRVSIISNYNIDTGIKVVDCYSYVNTIVEYIRERVCLLFYSNVYYAIEGLSFGSTGSRALDIAGYSYYLRLKLYELINNKIELLHFYAPTSIKKYAGGGKFKKKDMFDSFLNNTIIEENELKEYCRLNEKELVKKSGEVISPISDMIDACFIAELLYSNIKEKEELIKKKNEE
jgi:hypothetical protein